MPGISEPSTSCSRVKPSTSRSICTSRSEPRRRLKSRRAQWSRSRCGGSGGAGTRFITKRVRSSGQSKLLPL